MPHRAAAAEDRDTALGATAPASKPPHVHAPAPDGSVATGLEATARGPAVWASGGVRPVQREPKFAEAFVLVASHGRLGVLARELFGEHDNLIRRQPFTAAR
jgi:hypothetical protein